MANSLKTMWSALAVSLVTVANVNAAFYDDQSCPTDCPCPPSRPFLDPCGNWYFNAEGLYWEASQEGLNYATKKTFNCGSSSESSSSSSSSSFSSISSSSSDSSESRIVNCDVCEHGSVKDIGSSWDGGFRLGIGYDLPCDGWDVVANWTWFRTTADSHTSADFDANEFLVPAFGDGDRLIAKDISAKWTLNLNILDVELGREFCVSPCLSLRPFMGLRAAWVDQKYNVLNSGRIQFETENAQEESITVDVASSEDIRMKSKFSGFGVRGGLNSEWKVGCGFSLYGNVAASLLWGHLNRHTSEVHTFDIDIEDAEQQLLDLDGVVCADQNDKKSHGGCRAITDAALGVRWKQFFDCDRIALTLSIGWEHHCFFDQNRFENIASIERPNPREERGDLYTQGVTFAARLDF